MRQLRGGAVYPQVRTKLPATVYALGLTSLLNDAASDMIYPLLPLFLTTSAGAGAAALGMIEGAAEAMAAFLKIVSGHASDRTRAAQAVRGGRVRGGLGRRARSWRSCPAPAACWPCAWSTASARACAPAPATP